MSALETELEALLSALRERWCRIKPTEIRELWDPAETEPFYIAEEIPSPMYSWDQIEPYWREAENILIKFAIRTWDLRCKMISEDVAALNFMMHWDGLVKGFEDGPLGLDVRVSALARKTDAGWRFCQWIESPLGALPYLKATYLRNVDPVFAASL